MWQVPQTLFWPLMGLSFPRLDVSDFIGNMFKEIFENYFITSTEAIGLVIIIWFGVWLISSHKLGAFIRHGKIS